ncbi:MAG: hypothetical protein ACREA0_12535, partial [bacterium]
MVLAFHPACMGRIDAFTEVSGIDGKVAGASSSTREAFAPNRQPSRSSSWIRLSSPRVILGCAEGAAIVLALAVSTAA